jgi:hypothetical protein
MPIRSGSYELQNCRPTGGYPRGHRATWAEYRKLTDGLPARKSVALQAAHNLNGLLHLRVLSGDEMVGR